MNIVKKFITTGLLTMALFATPLYAQDGKEAVGGVGDEELTHCERNNPLSGYGLDITNFASVQICYAGGSGLFVVIDSVDNTVDIIKRDVDNGFEDEVYCFRTDTAKGRHDLVNILRPKSVGYYDGYVVLVASSKKDSSYLAVLDQKGNLLNRVDFSCNSYAFQVFPDEVVVVGRNQLGYDINILKMNDGLLSLSKEEGMWQTYHYKVPKQADRIRESDPHGFGLTLVAVMVVFIALVCISLILKGYGSLIIRRQSRKAAKAQGKPVTKVETTADARVSGDVYAAIAAAIYLYDEEMHDEEDTVITIQKVERAWTPWNAKYYNMNHYFQNKR